MRIVEILPLPLYVSQGDDKKFLFCASSGCCPTAKAISESVREKDGARGWRNRRKRIAYRPAYFTYEVTGVCALCGRHHDGDIRVDKR